MSDYSYQKPIIQESYRLMMRHGRVLLAACPGAGKTTMAIEMLKRFRKEYPNSTILILTHGQVMLRDQWLQVMTSKAPELKAITLEKSHDTLFDLFPKVIIGLPQAQRLLFSTVRKIDLILIDEAHHFYEAKVVQNIINHYKPTYQCLLTGTPSIFVDKNWPIVSITIQELLKYKVLCDPQIELVESKYTFNLSDYSRDYNLKSEHDEDEEETYSTLKNVLTKLTQRLTSSHLSKTMIVCNSQSQAKHVHQFFINKDIKSSLSISDYGVGTEQLETFKQDAQCKIFIVVNRGILGFDYPDLMNLVDLSGTLNVDRLFQMICRVVRTSSSNKKKLFLKIATPQTARLTYFVMSFVVAMSSRKYYLYKRGRHFSLDIPIHKDFALDQQSNYVKSDTPSFPCLPDIQCFEEFNAQYGNKDFRTYAYTTFNKVKSHLEGILSANSKHLNIMNDCDSRAEFRLKHRSSYEYLLKFDRESLNSRWPMKEKPTYDTDAILTLAARYRTKSEFREAHHGCFKHLARNNQLHLLKMEKTFTRWTKKKALEEAKKYRSKTQFMRNAGGAYEYLERKELIYRLDKFYKPPNGIQWNEEVLLEKVLQFNSLHKFKLAYQGGMAYMCRHKLYSKYANILKERKAKGIKLNDIHHRRDKSMVT